MDGKKVKYSVEAELAIRIVDEADQMGGKWAAVYGIVDWDSTAYVVTRLSWVPSTPSVVTLTTKSGEKIVIGSKTVTREFILQDITTGRAIGELAYLVGSGDGSGVTDVDFRDVFRYDWTERITQALLEKNPTTTGSAIYPYPDESEAAGRYPEPKYNSEAYMHFIEDNEMEAIEYRDALTPLVDRIWSDLGVTAIQHPPTTTRAAGVAHAIADEMASRFALSKPDKLRVVVTTDVGYELGLTMPVLAVDAGVRTKRAPLVPNCDYNVHIVIACGEVDYQEVYEGDNVPGSLVVYKRSIYGRDSRVCNAAMWDIIEAFTATE